MRVGFIADVHVNNHKQFGGAVNGSINERCRMTLRALERVADLGAQREFDLLVVAGDLFDTVKPLPQMTSDVLQQLCRIAEVHLLLGNHELVSSTYGDHALGPLGRVCDVIDRPCAVIVGDHHAMIHVPFQRDASAFGEVVAQRDHSRVGRPSHDVLAVVGHMGVYDDKMADASPWDVRTGSTIHVRDAMHAADSVNAKHALFGDWHEHKTWYSEPEDVRVTQIGALVPTGWNNPGLDGYGSLIILDTEQPSKIERIEIPGPRFINVSCEQDVADALQQLKSESKAGCVLYIRWTGPIDQMDAATGYMRQIASHHDCVAGWEFRPDRKDAEAKALKAATTASEQATLIEALATYTKEMSMPSTVSRERVLTRSRGFLSL